VQIPPAECQAAAAERPRFAAPPLAPAPDPAADPLAASADARLISQASREELIASRRHWMMRALRVEPLASAALEHIERDRVADANLDDAWDRCAAEDRRDAENLAAWAARNQNTRND
jgi:hypothetical protein